MGLQIRQKLPSLGANSRFRRPKSDRLLLWFLGCWLMLGCVLSTKGFQGCNIQHII